MEIRSSGAEIQALKAQLQFARHTYRAPSGTQFLEQRLSFFQIGGIETFCEPIVDVSEHCTRIVAAALIREQASKAHTCAQSPRCCAHAARHVIGFEKI